jgi:hypothetical protein
MEKRLGLSPEEIARTDKIRAKMAQRSELNTARLERMQRSSGTTDWEAELLESE